MEINGNHKLQGHLFLRRITQVEARCSVVVEALVQWHIPTMPKSGTDLSGHFLLKLKQLPSFTSAENKDVLNIL